MQTVISLRLYHCVTETIIIILSFCWNPSIANITFQSTFNLFQMNMIRFVIPLCAVVLCLVVSRARSLPTDNTGDNVVDLDRLLETVGLGANQQDEAVDINEGVIRHIIANRGALCDAACIAQGYIRGGQCRTSGATDSKVCECGQTCYCNR